MILATKRASCGGVDDYQRTNGDSNQGLCKTYKEIRVLNGQDLNVPKNSIFGFLGPNGSGKSTTIKLLLGLIRPTAGGATFFGEDIRSDTRACRVPGSGPALLQYMTARETVRYVANFFYAGQDKLVDNQVAEVIYLVGLEDKVDRPIKAVSGGEHQRLGIAQALVNYPVLLILDEPDASIIPQWRHDVIDLAQGGGAPGADELIATGIELFFIFAVTGGSIGVIIIALDEVVGDKTSGTAAWILSKPLSQVSFVLSKLASNAIGIRLFIHSFKIR